LSKKQITIVFIASVILLGMKASSARAKDIWIRPNGGSEALMTGNNNGTTYDNAYRGVAGFNYAVDGGSEIVSSGDRIIFSGNFIHLWASNNSSALNIRFSGSESNPVEVTGKSIDGHPEGIIYNLARQSYNQERDWTNPSSWLQTKSGVYYNEYKLGGNLSLMEYPRLMVDLDIGAKEWRYYTPKASLSELEADMQPGSFFAENPGTFTSLYTGEEKTRPRIWIIPFADLDSATWSGRTFTSANGFSHIDFFSSASHININNLEFFFGSFGNAIHIQYDNQTYTDITFDHLTWWMNANTPDSWIMAYRNGWSTSEVNTTNLTNWTIKNSDFRYGGGAGIFYITWAMGDVHHINIENNYFAYAGSNPDATGLPEDWIGALGGDNHVLAFQKGDDITIQGNTFYKTGGSTIESWAASGIAGVSQNNLKIIGNKFIKTGHKYAGQDSSTSGRSIVFSGDQHLEAEKQQDNVAAYNLFYDCEAMIGIGQRSPIAVYNNTGIKVGEGIEVGNNYFPITSTFKNNSVFDLDSTQVGISFGLPLTSPSLEAFAFQSPAGEGDTFSFHNNHFFDPQGEGRNYFIKGNDANANANLAQFADKINSVPGMSASGNIGGDPRYVVDFTEPMSKFDRADINFSLQSNSSLIDAGANVGLTADFEGTPVPQGSAPDIGAFEYHAGEPQYNKSDLNQDANINVIDLGILMSDFMKKPPRAPKIPDPTSILTAA
jgi:hypothetical protein